MKICEYCNNEHLGGYGSGRFCSTKCARGFSTKEKRIEINEKVSDSLSIRYNGLTKQQVTQRKIAHKHASYIRKIEVSSLLNLSARTVSKILKRMKLPCSKCEWYYDNVSCDIHHIIERKNGGNNEHENLTYLCPNCHRLVHNKIIKKEELINLVDYIGDEWKAFYFTKYK